jgi:hypothetical protein
MIKKTAIFLILATFLFCLTGSDQNVSAGGGGGRLLTLAIPPAAFRPNQDGYTYNNAGYWLEQTTFTTPCSGCDAVYYAPVHLSHAAVIKGFTAYIEDDMPLKSGQVDLIEADLAAGSISILGSVSSPVGTNSDFTPYSLTGLAHSVDNQNHAYYLRYYTPEEQTSAHEILLGGVQISYLGGYTTYPSYFSITGADFTPFSEQNDYTNEGVGLDEGSGSVHDYQAGVILPNGARLDQTTFYYYGASARTVSANLCRVNLNGTYDYINTLTSPTTPGSGSVSSTDFYTDRVDNNFHAYWLYYRFAGTTGSWPIPYGVVIKYTPKIYSADETIFSVPAASFVPRHGNYSYQNHGRYLIHISDGAGDTDDGAYMGPIAPPDGSALTFMSFMYGTSLPSASGELLLLRVSDAFNFDLMWSMSTLTNGGWHQTGSSDIAYNPIVYLHNAYYLRFNLPPSSGSEWVYAIGSSNNWAYRDHLPAISK